MTGGLRVKNNRWQMYVNYKDVSGVNKQKQKSTGLSSTGNKRQAQKMLDEYMKSLEDLESMDSEVEDMTFIQLLDFWLKVMAGTNSVSEVTLDGYRNSVEKHIKPYFSDKNLMPREVSTAMLQAYHLEKHKNGRLDGKGGLTGKSLKQHHCSFARRMRKSNRESFDAQEPAKIRIFYLISVN